MSEDINTATLKGHYDIRKGAAAYAPIVGAFGALAVPAITVLFTTSQPGHSKLISLAAGLLVVAMLGSLTGSVALAAIGAEQDETPNLAAAAMFIAVPVAVSIISVLAAFEVLAAIYLPESKTLFAVMTGFGGLAGTYFTSLTVADGWFGEPSDPGNPQAPDAWKASQWAHSRKESYRNTDRVAAASTVPAAAAIILRLFGEVLTPTQVTINWLVSAGLAISLAGIFFGIQRTSHPVEDRDQVPLRWQEAYATTFTVGLFTLAVLIFLP